MDKDTPSKPGGIGSSSSPRRPGVQTRKHLHHHGRTHAHQGKGQLTGHHGNTTMTSPHDNNNVTSQHGSLKSHQTSRVVQQKPAENNNVYRSLSSPLQLESTKPSPSSSTATVTVKSRAAKESVSSTSSKAKKSKSKVIYFWTSDDVNKWLKKHCGQYHQLYGDLFKEHDVSGRSLVRLTDWKLQMLGISDAQHREDIMRHIMKLKLKTEAQELKQLDQKPLSFEQKGS